jgi:glycosyltransferase involved in cell wall biosynthesis
VPKVCYISPISIHSLRYLEEFHQRGYSTSIIADSYTWVAPTPTHTSVHSLPTAARRNPPRYLSNLLRATRILKNINPSLVHLFAQHFYSPAIILSRKPYILTSWGTEVLALPKETPIIKILAKTAATMASKITVDANMLKKMWTRQGIPEHKIQVIPFGIDREVFNPKIDGSKIRKKLAIKPNEIVFISTRALYNHHYDVETFVRAIPLILKTHRNTKFIIKGKGPLENYLRTLAEKLGISQHVHFAGYVQYSEMANYLAAADIYVSTCFADTTSVSLLEAMACGLAPIVTDIEGNREWITDRENGFLFPPRNPAALAEKATQLIENQNLRSNFGEKCSETIKNKASWKECVDKMERIYQSTLQKG